MEDSVLHKQLVEDIGGRRNATHIPADSEDLQMVDLLHLCSHLIHLLEAGRDRRLDRRVVQEQV